VGIIAATVVTMVLTTHRMPITGRTTVLTITPTIVPITVPASASRLGSKSQALGSDKLRCDDFIGVNISNSGDPARYGNTEHALQIVH
jgi:hypothetical protein